MSAVLSDRRPKLSAPIYAGDNFRIARELSEATKNRPAARPSLPRREARNQPVSVK